MDIDLLDHRYLGALEGAPPLQEGTEKGAGPHPRETQFDAPGPVLPIPIPITVAVVLRQPLAALLAIRSAIVGADLPLHQAFGREYVSSTLMTWASTQGIAVTDIQPGKPQQDAYVSATTGRSGMNGSTSPSLKPSRETGQQIATEWLWTCNDDRPNMGIGGVISHEAESGRMQFTIVSR